MQDTTVTPENTPTVTEQSIVLMQHEIGRLFFVNSELIVALTKTTQERDRAFDLLKKMKEAHDAASKDAEGGGDDGGTD